MLNDIWKGLCYPFRGITLFYSKPRWWKYAGIPLILLFLMYALIVFLTIYFLFPALTSLGADCAGTSTLLKWILMPVVWLFNLASILVLFVVILFTFSTFYEIFGAMFFDRLVQRCESLKYEKPPVEIPFKRNLSLALQGVVFGLNSAVLSILLFPVGFIPFFGPALTIPVLGYRFALSYFFSGAFAENRDVGEVKRKAKRRFWMVLSFGCVVYSALLLPVVSVFFIPGFVVGGCLLYRDNLAEEK